MSGEQAERRAGVITKDFCEVQHKKTSDAFSTLANSVSRIEASVKNIDIAIRGNGKPGLKAEVRELKQKQWQFEQDNRDNKYGIKYLIGLGVAIIIASPIAFFAAALVKNAMIK